MSQLTTLTWVTSGDQCKKCFFCSNSEVDIWWFIIRWLVSSKFKVPSALVFIKLFQLKYTLLHCMNLYHIKKFSVKLSFIIQQIIKPICILGYLNFIKYCFNRYHETRKFLSAICHIIWLIMVCIVLRT